MEIKMNWTLSLLAKICEPTPKSIPDSIERILILRRNKTLFLIFLTLLTCLPPLLLFSGLELKTVIAIFLVHSANFLLFVALCRSYLWVYHLIFLALTMIAPHIYVRVTSEMAHMQMGHALIYPMYVLILTHNKLYGFLVVASHFYVILTKTKYILLENFIAMDPELFLTRFVHFGLTISFILLAVFSINIHWLDKRAREALRASKVSEETIEKQKTFLFSFSHEMRNPLNSLLGNIELALMESLPPKVDEMIKTAQICAEVLLHHINNVLDTGKQDIGSLEINLAQAEVHSMFQRVWSLSGELIKRKNLKGVFKMDKNVPKELLLETYRVNQVMINLIGNAIKFTEKGSISIDVKWFEDAVVNDEIFEPIPYDDENEGVFEKNQLMYVLETPLTHDNNASSVYDAGDYYILSSRTRVKDIDGLLPPQREMKGVLKIIISDTGGGMSAQSLKQLFQKFAQVSNDPNKRKIGTGLGLFITKEICTKMEADIRVYSKLGVGSTFIICIPTMSVMCTKLRPQMVPRSVASMFQLVNPKNLKCIVADDSPLNVAMMCNFFEKLSITPVNTAGNGEDAVNFYKQNRLAQKMVDIVTLDIDMPKMDGKMACQKIREFEKVNGLSSAIIILISGNYEAGQVNFLGKDKKADCFLKKPVTFEEFSSKIFRLLDTKMATPLVPHE